MHYRVLNASIVGRVGSAQANERAQTTATGYIVLKLKAPWRAGTTRLLVSPLRLMQRLAVLLPLDDIGCITDIDTLADLQAAQRLLAQRG